MAVPFCSGGAGESGGRPGFFRVLSCISVSDINVTEFRFADKPALGGKAIAGLRVFLWGCVAALFGLGAYAFWGPASPDPSTVDMLARLACFLVILAVLIVFLYGRKIGIAQQRLRASFLLTDDKLTYRRDGWPDSEVALSSISSLTENPDGLRVKSNKDSFTNIFVPRELDHYDSLRSALAEHQIIRRESRLSSVRRLLAASAGIGIPLLLAAAFYSQRPRAILIVLGCYIAWLVGTSFYISTRNG